MQVSELITDVWLAYRGKGVAKAPAFGSDKANDLLAIANRKLREVAKDPNNLWDATFEVRNIGAISTALEYELDEDVHTLSDYASILSPIGNFTDINIIKPYQRGIHRSSNVAWLSGQDPKVLTFNKVLTSYIGYDLMLGVYVIPETLTTATQTVPPFFYNWLVYAVASEIARNDPAKDDQFTNLLGMANDQYEQMVANNQNSISLQPNSVPYSNTNAGGWTI